MNVSKPIKTDALPLVQEEQYKLYINGIYFSDFFCTPEAVKELVIGNLYVNSHISSIKDIEKIDIIGYKIEADITKGREDKTVLNADLKLPELETIKSLARAMFLSAEIYQKHGGIHCSALSNGESIVAFKEDIGRHNAFDKVVGEAVIKGWDLSRLIYLTSGRVNHEVMKKASACGFTLIVSRSICSSSAFRLAEEYGIKLIGRILTSEPVIYRGF